MRSLFSKEFWDDSDHVGLGPLLDELPAWQQVLFFVIALALNGLGVLVALSPFAVAYLIVTLTGLPNNPLVLSLVVMLMVAVYLRFRWFFVGAYTTLSRHMRGWLVQRRG